MKTPRKTSSPPRSFPVAVALCFPPALPAVRALCPRLTVAISADDPLPLGLLALQLAGDRAASLTRQLLAFSRRQMPQPQVAERNTLVMEPQKWWRRRGSPVSPDASGR